MSDATAVAVEPEELHLSPMERRAACRILADAFDTPSLQEAEQIRDEVARLEPAIRALADRVAPFLTAAECGDGLPYSVGDAVVEARCQALGVFELYGQVAELADTLSDALERTGPYGPTLSG